MTSPAFFPSPTSPDPWEFAAQAFEPKPDPSTLDVWAALRLGETLWSKQKEIAHSLREFRYTAVASCHDAGKSYVASRAAAQWIDTHELGEAFVISTAPTAAQVSAILWREIIRAHKKGNLPGTIASAGYPQWKISGGELIGYGRKPADYSQAAFQGIHARFPLIILDEACGIPRFLWDAVDALATNEEARVLAIGNPDDPLSHFATICKPDSGWNVIRIDGLRTPNITQEALERLATLCLQCRQAGQTPLLTRLMREEGIPLSTEEVPDDLRPLLLSAIWIEERLHRWVGRPAPGQSVSEVAAGSALFQAKVRGLFPDSASEGVIPLGWVEAAMARWRDWRDAGSPLPPGRKVIGADIAREGEDETALAVRRGDIILEIRKFSKADTMETTGYISALVDEPFAIPVVDVIGVGAGVVDRLRELGKPVRPFNAAGSARGLKDRSGEFQFRNLRAAAWWNLREMLDPSRSWKVMLPDDEMLKADLTAPHWRVGSGGTITIESKEDIKKRLGRSTDDGDAVVQAFWIDAHVQPSDSGEPDVVSWYQQDEVDASTNTPWRVDEHSLEQWLEAR